MKEHVHRTPLTTSTTMNKMTGKQVYMKMENQQKTGAFKLRGAGYKLSRLSEEECKCGVIAASAGNHAQGVALAAEKQGIQATIFMPEKTPKAKVLATQNYGAKTVLVGESYQEAFEAACKEQARTKATFVHPFDDVDVMAGQGTVALEMLEDAPLLDTLIVPIGGGGLIAGMAVAAKHINPDIQIIGVQARTASAAYNHFHKKGPTTLSTVSTIAEGIAVKKTGTKTLPVIHEYVDDIVTVTENDLATAMMYMLERKKSLVEGAGAAALAALLVHGAKLPSKHCGVVVSGGNVDLAKLPAIQTLARNHFLSCLA